MSREDHDRLGTADLVAGADQQHHAAQAAQRPPEVAQRPPPEMVQRPPEMAQRPADVPPHQQPPRMQPGVAGQAQQPHQEAPEQLAALFPPAMASDFRNRWDQVQIGFVDDPRRAVQQADELVAQVMKNLAAGFAEQRARLEGSLNQGEQGNTEHLRMALRSYRSFFQRLLSL